jgi:hypothetical protein
MIHNLHFRMPEVKIRISQRCTQFNVVLHLDNKEEYSADFRDQSWGMGLKQGVSSIYSILSYIDHVLSHQIEHTRGSSGNTIGIRRRPQWTPPDSARYSYFDSAIQLSDGSHLIRLPSSASITSVTTDAPAPRHSSAQPP